MLAADGTNIKSGATKSHLVWDHGKHERHFLHGSSQMPELFFYVCNGYILIHSVHVCITFYHIRYITPSHMHTPFSQPLSPRNLQIHISKFMKMDNWKKMDHTHGTSLKQIPQTNHQILIMNPSQRFPGRPGQKTRLLLLLNIYNQMIFR